MKTLFASLVTVLTLATACNSESFKAGYCDSFKESFVQSCTKACVDKGASLDECSGGCHVALSAQPEYARCRAPQ